MRVLILGSDGLVGSELKKIYFSGYSLSAFTRADLDITNEADVYKKIQELKPNLIINAAGYTAVDQAETEKESAMAVNGHAVGYLAKSAKKVGAVFVHYSTDYVFGGDKEQGYTEGDTTAEAPLNVYGQSKLLGEKQLQKNTDNYYLIRTSWVFGAGGKDFVDTVLRLAESGEMRIKNDEYGKPTYARDLALATQNLIESEAPFGVYHLTNEDATNWYEFAKKIIGIYGNKKGWGRKELPRIIPVSGDEFPAPAKRPKYSILLNTKRPALRPRQEALTEYLQDID